MARLCEDGVATFVILDRDPLYSQSDIASICASHAIAPEHRSALWRTLEQAGRAFLDQRRLNAHPSRLTRVRQDLQLAQRLIAQLGTLVPQTGQTGRDCASVSLSRAHLSALREGERRVDDTCAGSLDDVADTLAWLGDVYDEALTACGEAADPEARWRTALVQFYTRSLARSWTEADGAHGERFLADCRRILDQGEGFSTQDCARDGIVASHAGITEIEPPALAIRQGR